MCSFEQTRLRARLYSLVDRNLETNGDLSDTLTNAACSGVGFHSDTPL